MDIPWDKPVPEELWDKVDSYCGNDVDATEALFKHLAGDWSARKILAELTNLTPNHTTQQLAAKFIFGDDRNPQSQFIYTDLSKTFSGYTFEGGKSCYKGIDPSEGGRVYASPGVYRNIALLDIESMHPTSAIELNAFGDKYTQRYLELKRTRLAIKHKEYEYAKKAFGGLLAPYLDQGLGDPLQYALKIVINIIYGLSSASFENPFRDPRNIDNIIAKRGSLFMIDLQEAVENEG